MRNKQLFRGYLAVSTGLVFCTLSLTAATNKVVRIIQTNSAGDNVHVIDPATNKVVGVIDGIEVNHGAAVAPDGTRIYISDEAQSTLDVVDAKTLKVTKRIPLSGHPNNIAVSPDGRRVYVGIIQAPGGVDVIDTGSLQDLKTLPTKGSIHNAYVTPDGRYVVQQRQRFQDDNQQRQAHGELRKNVMKRHREGELQAVDRDGGLHGGSWRNAGLQDP